MKIAFFVSEFPCISETFIASQVIALKKSGHEVHIYSRHTPGKLVQHKMINDSRLLDTTYYVGNIPSSRVRKITNVMSGVVSKWFIRNLRLILHATFINRSLLSVYNLIPFLDKPSYNVVHAHFGENGDFVAQLRALGLFTNARFITTFHGYDLDESYKTNRSYNFLFKNCGLFTVNSLYSKNRLKHLGCNEEKIEILPAGINTSIYNRTKKKRIKNSPITLVFIGRLIKLKGPHLFVEICNLLQNETTVSFNAIMIGEGPMYIEVERMVKKYRLESRLQLVGSKTQEEVVKYLNDADVFILPGITVNGLAETQGLVIQEAQAMQLPVLISDAGGMSEGIIDGETGFVIPENHLAGFVKKIELFSNDEDFRNEIGRAGRRYAEMRYDVAILNHVLLRLYQN